MESGQPKSPRRNHRHVPGGTAPPEATGETEALFTSESVMCRISREALVLLGGGRSILLQLAHPLIAAGVAEYSDFQSDPLGRLFRTMTFMHTLLFDDHGRARALQRFHAGHARIRGHLPGAADPYPAGAPYAGSEAGLKLWVHATFVDTGLSAYERFVRPLAPEERRGYYADSLTLARLLDIPQEILPPTLDAFQSYMADVIGSDMLSVTDTARRLARDVLHPQVGIVPAASAGLLRFVTAGLLPERLRVDYGLTWSRRRQFLLDRFSRTTRFLRPLVPRWVWQSPLEGGGLSRLLLWETTGTPA